MPHRSPVTGRAPVDVTGAPAGHLPAATHAYLDRAAASLRASAAADSPAERYATAHVAALQATAACLAAHAAPVAARRGRRPNAWQLLTEAEPELADWAAYFAGGAATRAAAEAGSTRAVDAAGAAALLEQSARFLGCVAERLGLAPALVVPSLQGAPSSPDREAEVTYVHARGA